MSQKLHIALIVFTFLILNRNAYSLCPKISQTNFYQKKGSSLNSSTGHTLLAPFKSKEAFLIDSKGRAIHTWSFDQPLFYAILKPNGNIVASFLTADQSKHPSNGGTGTVSEYSWGGKLIWSYDHPMMHHDFDFLPNGNIVILIWDKLPPNARQKLNAKQHIPNNIKEIWGDSILEITPSGKTVWIWRNFEYLLQERIHYDGIPITDKGDWSHANGLSFIKKKLINDDESLLISFRNLNLVIMVNRKSKQVTWSSKKLTSVQHDPTVTRSGNILIFNNRSHMSKSQVLMINPKNNELVWKYPVGEPKITDFQFSAGIVSGVQELDNGNILISNGVLGYISEVTKEGTRVWDLFSIPSQDSSTPWPYKGFFKVRQYSQKYFKAKIQSKIVKISKLCI